MLYLKCTADIQKLVGLRQENLSMAADDGALLGNWYVHRFPISRRKALVFMSETTFLSFILLQGKKAVTLDTLPNMLLAGLEQLLVMRGIPQEAVDRAFLHYQEGRFSKTDSRSALGTLNDIVFRYQWMIDHAGGLDACDLTDIIMRINETPHLRLGCDSWDAVQTKLLRLC